MFSNELQADVDITNGVYINNNPKMKDNSQTSVAKTCKKCCKILLIHNRDKRNNQTSYNHRSQY